MAAPLATGGKAQNQAPAVARAARATRLGRPCFPLIPDGVGQRAYAKHRAQLVSFRKFPRFRKKKRAPFRVAEEANLQNEEARVRVDSLNTEAHNLQLRETLRRSEEELNSKDRLIEKYQTEIRQRNDEIEKKVRVARRLRWGESRASEGGSFK